MDTRSAVVNRIEDIRESKGLTRSELGVKSGLTNSTLTSILNGKSKNPGIVTLNQICVGLGISLRELFDDDVFENLEDPVK